MPAVRSYIVAATPRTGSTLLCEGLWATRVAGHPMEQFAPAYRPHWREYFLLGSKGSFSEFLEAALRAGTTRNGVYGLKIHWMHLDHLARQAAFEGRSGEVLATLFPDAAYVNIVRRDRLAQALSFYRAMATDEWWRREPASERHGELSFAADEVRAVETDIARQQAAWEEYFARRGISALTVEYETLAEDYRGQIGRVLEFLGLDAARAHWLPPPRLLPQADGLTRRWRTSMEPLTS